MLMLMSTFALYSLLSGVLPHLPTKQSEDEEMLGLGSCRLVLIGGQLLALVTDKKETRHVAIAVPVVESDDEPLDVWLAPGMTKALVGLLKRFEAQEVQVRVEGRALEVRETGTLWGGSTVRVRLASEPCDPRRVDVARVLLSRCQARVLARASHGLWTRDAQAMGRTAEALGEPLLCTAGLLGDSDGWLIWGIPDRTWRAADGSQRLEPGSHYLGVSGLPVRPDDVLDVVPEPCYTGHLVPLLMGACLPEIDSHEHVTSETIGARP